MFQGAKDAEELLSGNLNFGKNLSSLNCLGQPKCEVDGSTLTISTVQSGLVIFWETPNKSTQFQDCFDLSNGVHWYGGPERRVQNWPLEKMTIDGSEPYVVRRDDNFGIPNRKMIEEPIWTTWAKYKRDITDDIILEFAQEVRNHGYNGQIEIDDNWETCYGAQEFSQETFSDVANTVKKLKEMGFRVTLWVHPFVNSDCQNNSDEGVENGYFVVDSNNKTNGSWWNSNDAHQIDFTNPQAAEWWSARLRKLQANPSVYRSVPQEAVPNILTSSYIRTCAKFGDLIEVRSAWSVLPDMIGGNGYNMETPSPELMVRWTQANTFMPAMQFSYLPWEITSPDVMEASKLNGSPVNPPIWWIDPTDAEALACDDDMKSCKNLVLIILGFYLQVSAQLPSCEFISGSSTYNCENIRETFPKIYYGNYNLQCKDCEIKIFSQSTFPHENSLLSMNLSNSGIQMIASEAFKNLRNIRYLYLNNNKITNISANAFEGLRQVDDVEVEHNLIVDLVPGFLNDIQLNTLSLAFNEISEIPDNAFKGSLALLNLNLQHNGIKKIHYDAFAGLDSLEDLDLQHNLLCHLSVGAFKELRALRMLNLANNKLTKFNMGTFSGLRDLSSLILANNFIQVGR
ncbi:unnamed protein product [Phaedon cochleariae]|uniref:Glycoside hydrolase family 31 TIM barrel domain-containing protein n=1 Tax=Phaedon cochleariae TaxID=80249 RepID=A0A9N9X0V4_PHACE|nr:unnamed protein product [Phaedon cochleariae]